MLDYQTIRDRTLEICAGLETEDFVVQPHEFISPPKWHLGHATWFFETMCLQKFFQTTPYNPTFPFIFNSYYEALGEHVPQGRRGVLSRPTVREVQVYRQHVDRRMREAASIIKDRGKETQARWAETVELGLHHEQQHQELLFMDIKHILSHQRELPSLPGAPLEGKEAPTSNQKIDIRGGVHSIGCRDDEGFCYDNERARHEVYLRDYSICANLVTNREFHEFIDDGGYKRPEFWLADGWEWVKASQIRAPLYWTHDAKIYTLQGEVTISPNAPVCHVSYFEADAFARWKKCRLPSEAEWEVAFRGQPRQDLWQWTASAYLPYPGFQPFAEAAQEYNGKFMSGQMVLRGGCLATPGSHYRSTYRNFFYPSMRWMFSGIRLCAQ